MKKHNLWKFIPLKLVALTFVLTSSTGVHGLEAQILHKKEAFPQLSSDQYQRIAALYPDLNKPAFVSLKLQVAKGDVIKVALEASCGVPDAIGSFLSGLGIRTTMTKPSPAKDRLRFGSIARSPEIPSRGYLGEPGRRFIERTR